MLLRTTPVDGPFPIMRLFTTTAAAILLCSVFAHARGESQTTSAANPANASPNAQTAAVSGMVVDGPTDAPLEGSLVIINVVARDGARAGRRQITDARGRFVFANLPTGDATIRVSRFGYLDGSASPGLDASGGRLVLRAAEWTAEIRLALWRPAAIEGTVVDERGEPVADIWVRLLTKSWVVGTERVVARGVTVTDDRGHYRFGELAPGVYVVEVPSTKYVAQRSVRGGTLNGLTIVRRFPVPPPPLDGRQLTYPSVFSPSARGASHAVSIRVGFGETRHGVDVTLQSVPALNVSGTVVGPPESLRSLFVRLVPQGAENLAVGTEAATAAVGEDGSFSFLNVPAGPYNLEASPTLDELRAGPTDFEGMEFGRLATNASIGTRERPIDVGPPGLRYAASKVEGSSLHYWARESIEISKDEASLVLAMRPTGTLRGTIIKDVDRTAPVSEMEPSVGIELDPADGSPALGVLRSDARPDNATERFAVSGLLAGKYFLRAQHGWIVKAVSWRGRDYTDMPFDATETDTFDGVEVVVTNVGAELTGLVLDERGAPAHAAAIMLFPSSPALWTQFGLWPPKIRKIVTAEGGSYGFTGLPAGSYNAIALDSTADLQLTPEFFKRMQQVAKPVTLSWGQKQTLNLSVHREVR